MEAGKEQGLGGAGERSTKRICAQPGDLPRFCASSNVRLQVHDLIGSLLFGCLPINHAVVPRVGRDHGKRIYRPEISDVVVMLGKGCTLLVE